MNCKALQWTNLTLFRQDFTLVLGFASCLLVACFFAAASSVGQSRLPALQSDVSRSIAAPTGKMTFSIDGKAVGSSSLVCGVASLGVGTLTASTHHALAAYSGDEYHAAAQTSETMTVK